jgi:hypothetical protein
MDAGQIVAIVALVSVLFVALGGGKGAHKIKHDD